LRTLDQDLADARAYHGHLCHGMVMGVRMARYGCQLLEIDDPRSYRDLMVYVEIDRCASDAVGVVCGVTLGRRRLKFKDYGKLAATFVDLATGKAIRVAPHKEVPHAGHDVDPIEFWKDWTDEALFTWVPVTVDIAIEDLPGPPVTSVDCAVCGESVKDCREVYVDGETLCQACAGEVYYYQT
jgi:formylmethanofuran dehydrogenase subunit E